MDGSPPAQDAVDRILPMCHGDNPFLGDVERQPGCDKGEDQSKEALAKHGGRSPRLIVRAKKYPEIQKNAGMRKRWIACSNQSKRTLFSVS